MKHIYDIKEIERGMYEVHGTAGTFRFFGYTKEEIIKMYEEECKNKTKRRGKK